MVSELGGERFFGALDGREFGLAGPVYLAGRLAPAGRYARVDGWGHPVTLPVPGRLPPSFDGRVAIYQPVAATSLPAEPSEAILNAGPTDWPRPAATLP